MTVAERPASTAGTSTTAGARRIGEAFARARAEGRAALVPYIVAGYPDADTSLAAALAAADAGADLLEVGTSEELLTPRRRAPERFRSATR